MGCARHPGAESLLSLGGWRCAECLGPPDVPGGDAPGDRRAGYGLIHELVHTAVGEASMCWSDPPAGEFESARALRIAAAVVDPVWDLCYEAWCVLAAASDWRLAEGFGGFPPAGLPPRAPEPESVEWAAAAARWRDRFHAAFGIASRAP